MDAAVSSPNRIRRLMPLILWSSGGLSVLGITFVVLWIWLPRWAPEWVVRYSPWVDPVLRAMAGRVLNHHLSIDLSDLSNEFQKRVTAWGLSATPAFIAGFESPDAGYRMMSVGAFDEAQSPLSDDVCKKICDLALTDDHHGVRVYAFFALRSERSPRLSEVRAQGMKDLEGDVRCAVVYGLDSTKSELDWQTLSLALNDPNAEVRYQAVLRCNESGEVRAVPRLLEMVHEENDRNFGIILSAFIRYKVVAAIPVLTRFLEGPTANHAPAVLRAITEIDAQEGFRVRLKLLDGSNYAVRAFVALQLGVSGDPRAIEPLTMALQDPDLWVMSQTIIALCHLKATSAVEAIIDRLEARYEDLNKWESKHGKSYAMVVGSTGMQVDLDEMLNQVGKLPLTSIQRERLERLRED